MKTEILHNINESETLPTIGVGAINNTGYSYKIYTEPVRNLEQKPNELCTDYYVQVGSRVRGKAYNDTGKTYTGRVLRFHRDKKDNSIIGLDVLLDKTRRTVTLSVDGLQLLIVKPTESKPAYVITPDYTVNNGLY